MKYPVIGFQVRRNSTVRLSKPALSVSLLSLGQDFVSKIDKSLPYFPAFVARRKSLKLLPGKIMLASPFFCE